MKAIFTLSAILLLAITIDSCKPGPNYIPSTAGEQATLAGVVFEGVITNVPSLLERNDHKTTISEVNYFKSCGPSEVTLQNFKPSSACGVDIPKVGTRVIIFGCKSDGVADFTLNDINIHTGLVAYSEANVNEIKTALEIDQSLPGDQCGDFNYLECQKK